MKHRGHHCQTSQTSLCLVEGEGVWGRWNWISEAPKASLKCLFSIWGLTLGRSNIFLTFAFCLKEDAFTLAFISLEANPYISLQRYQIVIHCIQTTP